MTLKLVKDGDETPPEEIPTLALDAIYGFLSQYEDLAALPSDEVLNFTLTMELRDGLDVYGSGAEGDYHRLVGQLEDAKQAVILQKMQERMMGED